MSRKKKEEKEFVEIRNYVQKEKEMIVKNKELLNVEPFCVVRIVKAGVINVVFVQKYPKMFPKIKRGFQFFVSDILVDPVEVLNRLHLSEPCVSEILESVHELREMLSRRSNTVNCLSFCCRLDLTNRLLRGRQTYRSGCL